jgi:predicted nucleic acid-binding protein
MKLVLNSMVVIHLSKLTLLKYLCDIFDEVILPQKVFEETIEKGLEKGYSNSFVTKKLIEKGLIRVKGIHSGTSVNELEIFGLNEGEAEAVALYFQEKADRLASDDNAVRKNRVILGLQIVGTPALIYSLFKKGLVTKEKTIAALFELKKLGWFRPEVLELILKEVEMDE